MSTNSTKQPPDSSSLLRLEALHHGCGTPRPVCPTERAKSHRSPIPVARAQSHGNTPNSAPLCHVRHKRSIHPVVPPPPDPDYSSSSEEQLPVAMPCS